MHPPMNLRPGQEEVFGLFKMRAENTCEKGGE